MELLIDNTQEDYLDRILKRQEDSLRFLCADFYNLEQIESLVTNQKRIRRKYHNREKIIVDKCNHEYIVFAILDMILPQITGIHIYFHYFCQGIGTKLSKKSMT